MKGNSLEELGRKARRAVRDLKKRVSLPQKDSGESKNDVRTIAEVEKYMIY
jgi:hypothetical protein